MEKFKNEEKALEAIKMLVEFAKENGSKHLSLVIYNERCGWLTDFTRKLKSGTYKEIAFGYGKEEE